MGAGLTIIQNKPADVNKAGFLNCSSTGREGAAGLFGILAKEGGASSSKSRLTMIGATNWRR